MKQPDPHKDLRKFADKKQAKILKRFFKTGPGEYGEGDVFIGVKVPAIRKVAFRHKDLPLKDALKLVRSKIHEERLLGLLVLTYRYQHGDLTVKSRVYEAYMANRKHINNWDLVDATAGHIVGDHLKGKDKAVLKRLAASRSLWDRRMAIIATFHYIRNNDCKQTLELAGILMNDPEDLIHKAVGWMLREVGKRDFDKETEFLEKNAHKMPRTMLRYAIERFPEAKRLYFLRKTA